MAKVWVSVIGSGTKADPYRPDIGLKFDPADGRWKAPFLWEASMPGDLTKTPRIPLVATCEVEIPDAQVGVVTQRTPTLRDEAIVKILQAKKDAVDEHCLDAADVREKLKGFYLKYKDALGNLTTAQKNALKVALVEAVRRGLKVEDAEALSTEYRLG